MNYEQEFECYAALLRELEQIEGDRVASEFLQAVSAGKAAIDGIKLLAQYAEEVKDSQKRGELMRIIGQLSVELAKTEIELSDCLRENNALKEEVRNLQEKLHLIENSEEKLIFYKNAYYKKSEDGFYCSNCYDSDSKKVRITQFLISPVESIYRCPRCKTELSPKPSRPKSDPFPTWDF